LLGGLHCVDASMGFGASSKVSIVQAEDAMSAPIIRNNKLITKNPRLRANILFINTISQDVLNSTSPGRFAKNDDKSH